MPLINVIVVILVSGILLWLAETQIPMAEPMRKILRAVVVIAVVLYLLQAFGVLDSIRGIRTPHV